MAVILSALAIVSSWVLIWAFSEDSSNCDVYCGPLPGMIAVFNVMALAFISWLAAISTNVVILLIGKSNRLASSLIIALFVIPPLTVVVAGWIERL